MSTKDGNCERPMANDGYQPLGKGYQPMIETCLAMIKAGHRVEVWSGRSDECQAATKKWLIDNGLGKLHAGNLRMRKAGDFRPDQEVKIEWLDPNDLPDLIFDDRARVVQMWRDQGIMCAQVAPGEF